MQNQTVEGAPFGGPVERAIVEAIDALAVPKVRDAVLALALRWAECKRIPERGLGVARFVEGPLFSAAEQVLGLSAAESIEAQLMPIAEMVRSEEVSAVRPSRPAPDGGGAEAFRRILFTPMPPEPGVSEHDGALGTMPAPAHVHSVAVASTDPRGLSQMSLALAGVATVHAVGDALAILEELDHHETDLVVIDCRRPVVSVETLLALGPELPDEARIVLWGERADLEDRLAELGIGLPESWVCCGPHASANDVGAVCRILLD